MMQNKIMIVEDEYIVSLDLRHMLEGLGYNVIASVARGEDVLPTALKHHPDLVLMDIQLAGLMKGTEAAISLKQNTDIPVIFLSAYCEESVLVEAEKSCPYGYLIKPFDRRELAATIRMARVKYIAEQNCRLSEQRLRLAMKSAQLSYWELDLAEDTLSFQGDLQAQLDCSSSSGLIQLLSLLADGERERFIKLLAQNHRFVAQFDGNSQSSTANQYLEFHAQLQQVEQRNGWIGVVADASLRQRREMQLRQSQAVFDTTAEAILLLDAQGRIYQVNPAFRRVTGYTLKEVKGHRPDDFLYDRDGLAPVPPLVEEIAASHWSGEVQCKKADGTIIPVWQHICKVRSPMSKLDRQHYVLMFSDISALRRAEEHLISLVHHDHLTGLGNRRKMEKVLQAEIARSLRNQRMLGLIYLDLDGFKLVNDTLGHHIGDLLLQQVARRLQLIIRTSDVAIRVGGDEFVIITPEMESVSDCLSIADKLLITLAQDILLGDNQVNVTASIGIALYPNDANSVADLLKCADLAMFNAKDRGRNCIAFFDPQLSEKAHLRMRLERDLKTALHQQSTELQLYYQPIFDAQNARIVGAEALMRWNHPELGWISPERFIKVAEHSGLIFELGEWLFRHVVKNLPRIQQTTGSDFYLAINLSARQFDEPALFERLQYHFDALNLWQHLQFELTETAFMQADKLEKTLQQIRASGGVIALDDFGTGYSSLSRLNELPLDCLKIDRSFVMHMIEDNRCQAIIEAICALGKALNLTLVAEGVETEAQYAKLCQFGCHRIQGYLFAKPMPLAQLLMRFEPNDKQ